MLTLSLLLIVDEAVCITAEQKLKDANDGKGQAPGDNVAGALDKETKLSRKLFTIVLLVLSMPLAASAQGSSNILKIDDASARRLLAQMSSQGNLKTAQHSEAWAVVATVALGMGIEKCGFPQPGDGSIFWRPALESMTPDQVKVLNRMVTANFRDAQTAKFVNLKQLFPITRQAVLFLSDGKSKWNCEEIAGVWQAATSYSTNRN